MPGVSVQVALSETLEVLGAPLSETQLWALLLQTAEALQDQFLHGESHLIFIQSLLCFIYLFNYFVNLVYVLSYLFSECKLINIFYCLLINHAVTFIQLLFTLIVLSTTLFVDNILFAELNILIIPEKYVTFVAPLSILKFLLFFTG